MAYPSITSVTPSTFATNTTAHAVAMAATHAAGELIVAIITNDGGATVATPSDWTLLYTLAGGSSVSGHAYAKVSDGTEGGTTVDFVTSANETMAAQVYRITNWSGTIAGIEAGTAATSTTGSTADNPALTASWGSADNLWLATCHTSTSQTASSAPTSYTDLTQTATGATTTDAQVITARRNNATATEDPDGFTMSGTGAVKVFNTLVIRPTAVQALTPSLFTNTTAFFAAVVVAGAVALTPDLYANANTFHTPTVATTYAVTPDLYSNTNTFHSATVAAGAVALTPDLFANTNTFFSPAVAAGTVALTPNLYVNGNTFYVPAVAAGGVDLTPSLFTNTNSFYSATVTPGSASVTPDLYSNTNTFYSPTVDAAGAANLTPALYVNSNTFYAPTINVGAANHILIPPLTGIAHEINGVLASPEALAVYRQSFTEGGSLLAAESGTALADTGYPVIESITQTTFAVDATAHLVSMPATVNAGDGLVVVLTTDGDATVTTPAGWKRYYNEANGTALRGTAYAKVARGTEGGTTVDFVTSASENGAAQVYRITNWLGSLTGIQAGVVGEITAGSTADPASVTAYWGSSKNIWLATCHTSTSQTVSSGPTSYTDLTQTSSAAATTGAQVISARRSLEAATEDPGVFTMSGSNASKIYNTIVIAPAYASAPRYEHFEITNGTTLWAGVYTSQPIGVADTGITRAVIVSHGSGLDAAEYASVVQNNLTDYLGRVIVVAPFFAESSNAPETDQLFWGSSWPALGLSDASLAWRISSGGVLDQLIDHLYVTFANLEGVILAGHSAGGQLLNRYSAASTDTRNRYLVSAASSYVYPGTERSDGAGGWSVPGSPATYNDYKYGLDALSSMSYVNAIGADSLRARLLAAKVHYMVGADDDDPADTSMDLTADAAVQGATRVERQRLYHDYLVYWDPGHVEVFPNLFSNTNNFYAPTVDAAGVANLTPDLFANANTFYTATVTPGAVALTPDLFANTNTFHSASVSAAAVALTPDLYVNSSAFYNPTVAPGVVDITADLFVNANTFYSSTVAPGSVAVTPDLYANTSAFYSPTTAAGAVSVTPDLYGNTNTFYAATVAGGEAKGFVELALNVYFPKIDMNLAMPAISLDVYAPEIELNI